MPTVAEAVLPGAQASSWGGIVVRAGTTSYIIERVNIAVRDAIAQPSVRQRMAGAGADPVASSPAEFTAFIRLESEKWGRVVREARITVS